MTRILSLALAVALMAGHAVAQTVPSDDAVAIGVTAGTPGLGVEAQFRLGPIFVLRGGVDLLTYDFDETYDGIDYAGQIDFDTAGGFVDLHPFANGFMLSGGAYVGDRNVSLDATPTMPVNIGGQTFTPGQVGTLNGTIKLKEVAPFVGLGFDNTFARTTRWGFRGIAGVAWSDEPEVALRFARRHPVQRRHVPCSPGR